MSTLTAQQRAQIERNRLAALQRRKQHQLQNANARNQSQFNRNITQNSRFIKPRKKRKFSQIQNENINAFPKVPLQSLATKHVHSNHSNYLNPILNHEPPQKKRRKIYENKMNNITHNTFPKNKQINMKHYSDSNTLNKAHKLSKNKQRKPKSANVITNYLKNQSIKTKPKPTKHNHKKSKKTSVKKLKKSTNSKHKTKSRKLNKSKTKSNPNWKWKPLSKTVLFQRLSHSKFRSKFKLGKKEIAIVHSKNIESHAFDFVKNRLSLAYPTNDGKQTPMRGHPVFIAQHATATCCRTCLSKWHSIQMGRKLTNEQIIYMVEVILHWINGKCPKRL